ncbi:elongation factor 4 [Candidatus Kuenenbacteria bacterium CG23_combo_of_CG06-09_8_20_14_all_36_9]|nr:MAG: elongation factor 4 [Candidatus Kuenenbacteria bacterium CG23_combo_of_CG06-09_8_20_14_all_36_9]
MSNNIRNFCIIAHIDHGKSTLADRFLELTNTVEKRKMKEQLLDQMDLERERGITIKLQPVRMDYNGYVLNLIDTPGHVDFTYEVSRSLAAVEGTILLVDATQGIQAQTLANYHLAKDQNLTIIPVINKIDLPSARIEELKSELVNLLKCENNEILMVSGKTGLGVAELLETIIKKIPSPAGKFEKPLQALIFDSVYDDYKGVVAYARIMNGNIKAGDKIHLISTSVASEILEVGYFKPQLIKSHELKDGEIGYIVTGLKDLSACKVGDTIIDQKNISQKLSLCLPGYKEIKPMVFAGIFCKEGVEYYELREGLQKIKLTDASLFFEPENSPVLGPGFRCGFLGLLHLEIIQERLKREYELDLIVTTPSVAYQVKSKNGENIIIHSPQELPNQNEIIEILEPWVRVDIITPKEFLGGLMSLMTEKRGIYLTTDYFSNDSDRIILHYEMPLSSILTNFYDKLKSASSGYGSLNYEIIGYRACEVERLDILVAEELVDSLSLMVYKDEAYRVARKIVESLKNVLARAMFEIKIQAVLGYQIQNKNKGGKVIASERIAPLRKDVTGYLYGGDVTRKMKLLEKQKKGKKKMKALGRGRVDIPTEAYLAVLKR